jgi:hypothetical protein
VDCKDPWKHESLIWSRTQTLQTAIHAPQLILTCLRNDVNKVQKLAEKVTFTANGQLYTRTSIESIQLLHYKSLDSARILDDRATSRMGLLCLDSSEIVVFYDQEGSAAADGDITRHILHCITLNLQF